MGDITISNVVGSTTDGPINLYIPYHKINAIEKHTIDAIKAHTINAIESHTINAIERHTIQSIDAIKAIAPVAAHIKEVNHIDPISIESLHVREVRNVEPIQIEKLNITNLPAVNLSIRQLPSVNVDIRRMPPLSIGLHQQFEIPSDYTLRASFLGFECVRMRLQGKSVVVPRDQYRREVSRSLSRSYAEVAAGGNPAIPSRRIEKSLTVVPACPPRSMPVPAPKPRPQPAHARLPGAGKPDIRCGAPSGSYGLGAALNGPRARQARRSISSEGR